MKKRIFILKSTLREFNNSISQSQPRTWGASESNTGRKTNNIQQRQQHQQQQQNENKKKWHMGQQKAPISFRITSLSSRLKEDTQRRT